MSVFHRSLRGERYGFARFLLVRQAVEQTQVGGIDPRRRLRRAIGTDQTSETIGLDSTSQQHWEVRFAGLQDRADVGVTGRGIPCRRSGSCGSHAAARDGRRCRSCYKSSPKTAASDLFFMMRFASCESSRSDVFSKSRASSPVLLFYRRSVIMATASSVNQQDTNRLSEV